MSQFGGASAEERHLERRRRLLTASASVFARSGFRGTTVKAVCTEVGLTERYFFESFRNSEALILALHREISRRIIDAILEVRPIWWLGLNKKYKRCSAASLTSSSPTPTKRGCSQRRLPTSVLISMRSVKSGARRWVAWPRSSTLMVTLQEVWCRRQSLAHSRVLLSTGWKMASLALVLVLSVLVWPWLRH